MDEVTEELVKALTAKPLEPDTLALAIDIAQSITQQLSELVTQMNGRDAQCPTTT